MFQLRQRRESRLRLPSKYRTEELDYLPCPLLGLTQCLLRLFTSHLVFECTPGLFFLTLTLTDVAVAELVDFLAISFFIFIYRAPWINN